MIKNLKDFLKAGVQVSIILQYDKNRDTVRAIIMPKAGKKAVNDANTFQNRFLNGTVEDIENHLNSQQFASELTAVATAIESFATDSESDSKPTKTKATSSAAKSATKAGDAKPATVKKPEPEDKDVKLLKKVMAELDVIIAEGKEKPKATSKRASIVDLAKTIMPKLDDEVKAALKDQKLRLEAMPEKDTLELDL